MKFFTLLNSLRWICSVLIDVLEQWQNEKRLNVENKHKYVFFVQIINKSEIIQKKKKSNSTVISRVP